MLASAVGPRAESGTVKFHVYSAGPGVPYQVDLTVPDLSDAHGELTLDLADLAGKQTDPEAYGRDLGTALFADNRIRDALILALAAIDNRSKDLHVQLLIDPPELQGLAWERLAYKRGDAWWHLATSAKTPLSRYVRAQGPDPRPVADRPLRILSVVASPGNLPEYGLDPIAAEERAALGAVWAPFRDATSGPLVTVTTLESGTAAPPTLPRLRQALNDGYHLIHFLCHGRKLPGGTVVYLEREDGRVDAIDTATLAQAIGQVARPPALCFLAACESAARGGSDAFVPLGPSLVGHGPTPVAVVAMSDRVGLATARLFTSGFYARLLTHGVVDLAMSEARAEVQEQWDWGVPVLFSRCAESQLLDFPISATWDPYLDQSNDAFHIVRDVAQGQQLGLDLVKSLEELVAELSKSHKIVADYAADFRDVGDDPATFAQQFRAYFSKFKRHYDTEDWVDEQTSCNRIRTLTLSILPRMRPHFDQATFDQLSRILQELSVGDGTVLYGLRDFLDQMNSAVETIDGHLRAANLEGALQAKRDFDAHISPLARRTRDALGEMSQQLGQFTTAA